jgi:hypothetical protein
MLALSMSRLTLTVDTCWRHLADQVGMPLTCSRTLVQNQDVTVRANFLKEFLCGPPRPVADLEYSAMRDRRDRELI